jgi:nucleosome assembly protein 1-like 1
MEQDFKALDHLTNVEVKPVADEPHSFSLEFNFSENPYFENTTLVKTYHLFEHPSYGEIMFDSVTSTELKWKTGKNLTLKTVTKTTGGNRGGRRGGKRGGGR